MPTPIPTPTRLRTATDYTALAALCCESAPHSSPQPSNRPVRFATAARIRSARAHSSTLSCPAATLNSPQAAFNPHTSTALAAYCKSPYPHRSALPPSPTANSCLRSAVDTALEMLHSLRNPQRANCQHAFVRKAGYSATCCERFQSLDDCFATWASAESTVTDSSRPLVIARSCRKILQSEPSARFLVRLVGDEHHVGARLVPRYRQLFARG